MVVNPLVEQGHLEYIENPAHTRSRLTGLTEWGRAAVDELRRREMEFLRRQATAVDAKQLIAAADTLRQVREMLESEKWRRPLEGN